MSQRLHILLMCVQGYYDCPLCPSDSCRLRTTSRDFVRRHVFIRHDGKDFKTHHGGRFGGIFAEIWQLIGAKRQYRDETIRGIDHETKLPTDKTRKRRRRQNERMTEHVRRKYGVLSLKWRWNCRTMQRRPTLRLCSPLRPRSHVGVRRRRILR